MRNKSVNDVVFNKEAHHLSFFKANVCKPKDVSENHLLCKVRSHLQNSLIIELLSFLGLLRAFGQDLHLSCIIYTYYFANQSFSGLEEFTSKPIVIKPIVENSEAKASKAKPKAVRKNNGALIIEDWVFDNEEDDVPWAKIEKKTFKPIFAKIEFVKPKQQAKTARKTVNHVEQNR
ncbi:hypothetical protein Tco_0217843 [Tanacetum coccineum]